MKRIIVSGFFNPLHGGHLDLFEAAKAMGDYLIVLVNNDEQQMIKKGKIILNEENRARLVGALRIVDEVIIGIDKDDPSYPITESLALVADKYPHDELVFCNGGDDRSNDGELPGPEAEMCRKRGITMAFGVGGTSKFDSSSRINKETGVE